MSYQVLARKWRPRNFHEMVGQSHVLRALINALDNDRLHHAYLFTGTRGVGKTTIARILAKCLNCEQGVTSTPCGKCGACREIDEGRFIDLIEVDAASRTKVEDTRELLDNVQYAPTRGRYKVYLIDEVHMLSAHSFNALLKTLEEPPPHVKFLLATTDPQKLPITILSRCLQFSLKNMTPERIVGHLDHVLKAEQVEFDQPALWALGRAADGSMRDALSLLDQAIAFGDGRVAETDVAEMLGTLDRGQVYGLAEALAQHSAANLLAQAAKLSELSPDYAQIIADLLELLHRVALAQLLPDGVDNSQGDRDRVLALAQQMLAEDVQLYYQIGLHGRRDLPLAPEPRIGFEMALMRMLAFRPDGVPNPPVEPLPGSMVSATDTASQNDAPVDESVGTQGEQVSSSVQEVEPVAEKKSQRESAQTQGAANGGERPEAYSNQALDPAVSPSASLVDLEVVEEPASVCTPTVASPSDAVTADAPLIPIDREPALRDDSGLEERQAAADAYSDYAASQSDQSDVSLNEVVAEVSNRSELSASALAVNDEPAEAVAPSPSTDRTEPARAAATQVPLQVDALTPDSWITLAPELGLGGVTGTVLNHSELVSVNGLRLVFRVDQDHGMLFNPTHQQRIMRALQLYFKEPDLQLEMTLGSIEYETPAQNRERCQAARLAQAREQLYGDPLVKRLQQDLAAEMLDHTIVPID